jgi:hypothetical protein
LHKGKKLPLLKAARAHDGASAPSVKSKMPSLPWLNASHLRSRRRQIALAALALLPSFPPLNSAGTSAPCAVINIVANSAQNGPFRRRIVMAQEEPMTPERYEREELGVNSYTAPSISQIFDQLDRLRPLPFDKLWRDLPAGGPAKREQQALIFGQLVADGFLIVEAEKRNLIDDLGRVLIREARGLGVADRVMKHSASLTELGKAAQWPAVRKELVATQGDVEQAMIELRDQKMAHLISLGGWLRGLEISAGAVAAKFSPDRAAILVQPKVVDYFDEELRTLPPSIAHEPLFERIRAAVKTLHTTIDGAGGHLLPDAVQSIYAQVHELNLQIGRSN